MSFWDWLKDRLKQQGSFDGSLIVSTEVGPIDSYDPPPQQEEQIRRIGELSRKYEVGPKGSVGTISKGTGDPGGKSYGLWQLASKTGTLQAFIKQSRYKQRLSVATPASAAFDRIWKHIAIEDPKGFEEDQYSFIKSTHYDPVHAYWIQLGGPAHSAVFEVLWSIGVQHGKAKTIVANAMALADKLHSKSYEGYINSLYDARESYVKRVIKGKGLLTSLLNRYKQERKDALKLLGA